MKFVGNFMPNDLSTNGFVLSNQFPSPHVNIADQSCAAERSDAYTFGRACTRHFVSFLN